MSICNSQDAFDDAFYHALKHSLKKDDKKLAGPLFVYFIIHLIFLIWGVLLAFRQPEENRVVHITLAIVFGPAYVLAYYLSQFE